MQLLKISESGPELVIYNSIKELPIEVSKQFSAYLVQQIGIGNTMEDVDDHLERITSFLQASKMDDAIEETKNLRFGYFSMLAKWDFQSLAFACLIKSVDGKPLEDRGMETLNALIEKLSEAGLTNGMVEDILSDVKKKLIPKESYISLNTLERI